MKNDKIISSIKTAGVAVTAAFTMVSCGGTHLSENQTKIVEQKTDSAARFHHEYQLASGLHDLCEARIKRYHEANKGLLKMYARDYITKNLTDVALKRFMLGIMEEELAYVQTVDTEIVEDDASAKTFSMRYIRKNQRWFNDLMLFLADRYTEKQLLNSEFFKVITDSSLRQSIERNSAYMAQLKADSEFTLNRKNTIYTELWNQYAKEVQKKR